MMRAAYGTRVAELRTSSWVRYACQSILRPAEPARAAKCCGDDKLKRITRLSQRATRDARPPSAPSPRSGAQGQGAAAESQLAMMWHDRPAAPSRRRQRPERTRSSLGALVRQLVSPMHSRDELRIPGSEGFSSSVSGAMLRVLARRTPPLRATRAQSGHARASSTRRKGSVRALSLAACGLLLGEAAHAHGDGRLVDVVKVGVQEGILGRDAAVGLIDEHLGHEVGALLVDGGHGRFEGLALPLGKLVFEVGELGDARPRVLAGRAQ
mmetsp:Transcript_8024/g.19535  ORF Transcript_8024/g.19535 Transcript_8024/m.19535 type:complete len:268 (+) Transcript_8024:3-806(+)